MAKFKGEPQTWWDMLQEAPMFEAEQHVFSNMFIEIRWTQRKDAQWCAYVIQIGGPV